MSAFFLVFRKGEAVNKSAFGSEKNNFSLAINSSLKTIKTSITSQQFGSLKRRLIIRFNSFRIFDLTEVSIKDHTCFHI